MKVPSVEVPRRRARAYSGEIPTPHHGYACHSLSVRRDEAAGTSASEAEDGVGLGDWRVGWRVGFASVTEWW